MEGHLVGFGAATDLEENEAGYSEIGEDLPSGTCRYNETKVNKDGERYLVESDKGGYESRKRALLDKKRATLYEQGIKTTLPKGLQEKLEKYRGKGLNPNALAAKFQDGYDRRKVVEELKKAKTKEEKIKILEEFHKEAKKSRKQTALKLKSMEETRIIRQEVKQKVHPARRTYRTISG